MGQRFEILSYKIFIGILHFLHFFLVSNISLNLVVLIFFEKFNAPSLFISPLSSSLVISFL